MRHQGSQNGTTWHQPAQIPGSGDFLPKFLPKQAAKCGGDDIPAGHGRKLELPAGVCYQPSKLVMRVRFPSPAPIHWLFSICCSHNSCLGPSTGPQICPYGVSPAQLKSSNLVMLTRGLVGLPAVLPKVRAALKPTCKLQTAASSTVMSQDTARSGPSWRHP